VTHLAVRPSAIARRPRNVVLLLLSTYLLLRMMNALVLVWFATSRGFRWHHYILSWDSQWLLEAARDGWPVIDLSDATASQTSSTWAWPPLAALLARWTGWLLGDGAVAPALVTFNFVGGAVASLILYWMVSGIWNRKVGLAAALTWMAMPGSPVLVMGYAEGVFAAFAFSALWALQRERYVLAAALLVPAGLTKLQVVPFALAVLAVIVFRWWRSKWTEPAAPVLVTAGLLAVASMLAWPIFTAVRLGSWDAYSQVRSTWNHETTPFLNTFNWIQWLVDLPNRANILAALALLLSVVAAVWAVRSASVPAGFKWVGVTTPLFLAFAGAGVSTVRYLLPDPVIALFVSRLPNRLWQWIALGSMLVASQIVWIQVFVLADPGSTPP